MDEHQYPLVTISGPPAAGTTTLSTALEESLDFELINGGDIFRRIAVERDLTLDEMNELAKNDDSIDKELDARLQEIIVDHLNGEREPDGNGLIVESRLAGWHADGRADVSVYLHAPLEVRVERIDSRDETVEELARREQNEAERYKDYYGIDVTDTSVYDIIIDTSSVCEEEMVDTVTDEIADQIQLLK